MSLSSTSIPPVSAYIPCYNNAETLASAISGIRSQSIPVDDFFVVDDGSTDGSREIATALEVRVVEMKTNQGRGAVRARAMVEARHDPVLCCDATNRLQDDFLKGALAWFSNDRVAAVSGRMRDLNIQGALGRWRARHLFRQAGEIGAAYPDNLNTWGTLMRKGAVMEAGNFDARLRFGEDFELGRRLIDAGCAVWCDPSLIVASLARNTLSKTMERFLRWQPEGSQRLTFGNFMQAQRMAFRILAPIDLREGDPMAALISLLMPYYKIVHRDHFRKIATRRE